MSGSFLRRIGWTAVALGLALSQACRSAPEQPPVAAPAAGAAAGVQSADPAQALAHYRQLLEGVSSDLVPTELPPDAKPALMEWLNDLKDAAGTTAPTPAGIDGLKSYRVPRGDDLVRWFNARCESIEDEGAPDAEARSDALNKSKNEWIDREHRAWMDNLDVFIEDQRLIEQLVVRRELLERKYLQDEYVEGGNFLEGFVNSRLGFTRYEEGASAWYRTAGVSAFEVPFRIEPLVGLEDDELSEGLLLSTGLLYHLFPAVSVQGFEARSQESLWSKYLKRIGLRVGAGIGFEDGESGDFVLAAGLQVRSLTAWAVRDFEQDETTVMLGLSDLGFLEDWLPGLGLGD